MMQTSQLHALMFPFSHGRITRRNTRLNSDFNLIKSKLSHTHLGLDLYVDPDSPPPPKKKNSQAKNKQF